MEPKRRTLILSFSVVILIILSAISGFGPAASLIDEDGDGIFDWSDNCPSISNSIQADNDVSSGLDGGDACDSDDDNDGTSDVDDAFPFDNLEDTDSDGDGIGNNADDDDDDDGWEDHRDMFPEDSSEWFDYDYDGIGDNADNDDDNDGWMDWEELDCWSVAKDADSFPNDNDGDGVCDRMDLDIDGDGLSNEEENFCGSDQYNSNSTCQSFALWKIDGRMAWEVDLLFDTCDSRDGDWQWPENLSSQDDVFLYPGELRCEWEIQGNGDLGAIAIYSHVEFSLVLNLSIIGNGVEFTESNENPTSSTWQVVTIEPHRAALFEIKIIDEFFEGEVGIIAEADGIGEVQLDLQIFQGSEHRELHTQDGDSLQVHYRVWDADTGELLDEGDLPVTAGDDPTYIDGFGWSAIGLDIDGDRGLISGIDTGSTHTTLLPPPIAYGNSDGHELQDSWLVFELKLVSVSE